MIPISGGGITDLPVYPLQDTPSGDTRRQFSRRFVREFAGAILMVTFAGITIYNTLKCEALYEPTYRAAQRGEECLPIDAKIIGISAAVIFIGYGIWYYHSLFEQRPSNLSAATIV